MSPASVMVWCAERSSGDQGLAGGQHAGDGVDLGGGEGFRVCRLVRCWLPQLLAAAAACPCRCTAAGISRFSCSHHSVKFPAPGAHEQENWLGGQEHAACASSRVLFTWRQSLANAACVAASVPALMFLPAPIWLSTIGSTIRSIASPAHFSSLSPQNESPL